MNRSGFILKWSLFSGSAYFLGISVVHTLGLKIPGLYVYFDIPSYVYQDRITSFLAFGWAAFFFVASRDPQRYIALVKGILVSGAVAILGLITINITTNFADFSPPVQVWLIWLESGALCCYWIWLVIFYLRLMKEIS